MLKTTVTQNAKKQRDLLMAFSNSDGKCKKSKRMARDPKRIAACTCIDLMDTCDKMEWPQKFTLVKLSFGTRLHEVVSLVSEAMPISPSSDLH